MEQIERRGFLGLLLGIGAATVCGLSVPTAEAGATATEPLPETQPADAAEAVEAELQPDQFFIVRRRRRFRRAVVFRRPRRRVYFVRYRRPRRRFFVVRRFRRRRW